MEHLLSNLAKRLDAIDETSLMQLWPKYARLTAQFSPTKEWEEAALVFCLIQAKHFKNQLFNEHIAKMGGADQIRQPRGKNGVRAERRPSGRAEIIPIQSLKDPE
ncbi:MAG: hypothetical protein PUB69_00065 [Desulfovibrionaceae bacterium]|nr:hypothetical protein [Desulfovibrionaceae bacterium]